MTVMVDDGRLIPGLRPAISGSFHFLTSPRKMSAIVLPLSVALTDDDALVDPPPVVVAAVVLPLLDPQALTPRASAPAVAAASHMRDMECFSFDRFMCRQGR